MRMIEESLRLLQTDHVDIWQLDDIGTMTDVDQLFAKRGAGANITTRPGTLSMREAV